ncbi:MAG: helix-turn-helix transcriptional regulator [Mycobacterium sp.]|nr:helix-turn-helix transcriptional regulator [Mycobacterium sp.]
MAEETRDLSSAVEAGDAGQAPPPERILAATKEVLRRSGTGKLNISEVAITAGVSRPTLYRWFATKEDLLDAFGKYERRLFDAGMTTATKGLSGRERLDAGLRYIAEFQHEYWPSHLVDSEPEVAIAQTETALPGLVESLMKMIPGPAATLKATTAVRVAVSHYLVPSTDSDELLSQLREAVGLYDMTDTYLSSDPVTVEFFDGNTRILSDDDRWLIREGGALEITDAAGAIAVYSPTHWRCVSQASGNG